MSVVRIHRPKEGDSSVEEMSCDPVAGTFSVKFRKAKAPFVHQTGDKTDAFFDAALKFPSKGQYYHRFIRRFPMVKAKDSVAQVRKDV